MTPRRLRRIAGLLLLGLAPAVTQATSPPPQMDCTGFAQTAPPPAVTPAGRAALREWLAQPNPNVACLAKALRNRVAAGELDALAAIMVDDRCALVRSNAAAALGSWENDRGAPQIFKALSRGLDAEPDPHIVVQRIDTLARLMLWADDTFWLDAKAVALTLEDVLRVLDRLPGRSRAVALNLLADMTVRSSPGVLLEAGTVSKLDKAFAAALADPSPDVRAQAAAGLGALMHAGPRHVDALVALLADPDMLVRIRAAGALAQLPALPDLPAAAVAPLQAMANRGERDAENAILALSHHPSPEVVSTLVALLERPPAPPRGVSFDPYTESTAPPRDLAGTAHGALRTIGSVVTLPLLAHVAATTSTASRDRLYATLVAIGWEDALDDTGRLAAALGPAMSARDPEARAMAVNLLAIWRPRATQRYPDELAEAAVTTWFPLPGRGKRIPQTYSDVLVMLDGWGPTEAANHGWARDAQVSAAIVAGNSRSGIAAERMIAWMCAGGRLETASVHTVAIGGKPVANGQRDTIRSSLVEMGPAAAGFIVKALAQRPNGACRETLVAALAERDRKAHGATSPAPRDTRVKAAPGAPLRTGRSSP